MGRWVDMEVGWSFFGQVMSPHHSDKMYQKSQVSGVALCMSKVKVPSVREGFKNPNHGFVP